MYLVSQALAIGLPTVVALNMIDIAKSRGLAIDVPKLRERLGVPVVEVQANGRRRIAALKDALRSAIDQPAIITHTPFPPAFAEEVELLSSLVTDRHGQPWPRYLVERLLLDTSGYLEHQAHSKLNGELGERIAASRGRLAAAGYPVPMVEAVTRYDWVAQFGQRRRTPAECPRTWTDRLDRILTHRVWGSVVFAVLMLLMFSSIFVVASQPMAWIDGAFGSLGDWIEASMSEGALRSLLVDGIIGGAGSVVVFLPQILILFLFIAILEDCGYMARAAYLMDKLMVRVGLSGKSFIPLLSSFACTIRGLWRLA